MQLIALMLIFYEMKGTSVKKFVIIMTCENGDVEVYEEYDGQVCPDFSQNILESLFNSK